MFESFCDPVFLIDPEGTILNANGVLAARFDKQSEECIGANIYDLLAFVQHEPEIAAYRKEKANEALMTGKEVIFKDVHAGRFLKHTVSPIRSRDGNVTNLLIFVQDISTLKLDEPAPQKELAVYNALSDTNSLSFSIMDANGSMIAWNQYMRDIIIGKTEDEMPGFNGIETIHPDDRAIVLEKISKILNQDVETFAETRVLLHGGPHYQWQKIHGRRIMIDEKPSVMFIGIDVTDHLHVEDKLNNSSLWFSPPREAGRVGIWQLELKTGKITWSDELWSFHGKEQGNCPPSVALWISTVHPLDRNMVIQTITEAANNETEVNVDYRVRYPDGSVHWLMAHGLPVFDDTGHAIRYIGAIIDITERKHSQEKRENLQKQLQQSQTSQLVGQLAGGIAHDFNNMMAAILGNTELLLDEIDDSNPFSENLEDIRNSAIRAKDMVHQLLSFARQQVIVPKILTIDEAIANLLPLLRRLVNDNIQFEWHLNSKHVRIYIDPSQFDQIIANLFVNARDAISGSGTITVGSGTIHIKQNDLNTGNTFLKPGDYVRLSVTDTGCGIDKKHLPHIFEPFFSAKKAGKGTGLELSIVYGIVKQNNGHIDCKTNPGKSTTFNIYLPRHLEFDEHKKSEPSEHAPELPGKETILLVEDEPDIRYLIHKTLEIEGYNVLVAPRAEEAVRIALRHRHQLVLLVTDIVLPRMNGVQLYDTLQDLKPGLKVLFMSDNPSDEIIDHQRTLQDGVGFINKPFSIRNFIQTFYTVLHPRTT